MLINYNETSMCCSSMHYIPGSIIHFFLVPLDILLKQCIIMLNGMFLEVSFYHISCSEFLVLICSIFVTIISEESIVKVT